MTYKLEQSNNFGISYEEVCSGVDLEAVKTFIDHDLRWVITKNGKPIYWSSYIQGLLENKNANKIIVTDDKYAMQILRDHGVNYLTGSSFFKLATGKDMPQEDQSVIYGQLKQEDIEKAVSGIKELVKNGTLKVEDSDVKEGTIYGGEK